MTYVEVIDFLYNQLPLFQNSGPGAYKPGLDTALTLAQAFGNPHERLRTIHVAGTNGKGSTSHTIASVLQAAGYKVGLYTSPHLLDFRERIRIDGQMISKTEVVDFIEPYQETQLDCSPSFFELTTIMAFDHFVRHNVDVAVIEVGLGGRLDTTNIITPLLSIITNISLDHTSLLGNTEVEIAREKAGIIKPGIPVVIGEANSIVRKVFSDVANNTGSPVIFAEDVSVTISGDYYSIYPGASPVAKYQLKGEYQHANANTVMAALRCLRSSISIPDEAIITGFSNVSTSTGLAGRWQVIQECPVKIVCDTGHNIGAWLILGPVLATQSHLHCNLLMVIGFVNDKDVSHIFQHMPKDAAYYFVTPSVARGLDSNKLLSIAKDNGLKIKGAYSSVAAGYEAASQDTKSGDMIFVGGSTFVVADFLAHFSQH